MKIWKKIIKTPLGKGDIPTMILSEFVVIERQKNASKNRLKSPIFLFNIINLYKKIDKKSFSSNFALLSHLNFSMYLYAK